MANFFSKLYRVCSTSLSPLHWHDIEWFAMRKLDVLMCLLFYSPSLVWFLPAWIHKPGRRDFRPPTSVFPPRFRMRASWCSLTCSRHHNIMTSWSTKPQQMVITNISFPLRRPFSFTDSIFRAYGTSFAPPSLIPLIIFFLLPPYITRGMAAGLLKIQPGRVWACHAR
jgi:hypothetical protein